MSSPLKQSKQRLNSAVHRSRASTWDGILERLFTFAFKGMVYPQIWEDPEVDIKALNLAPGSRLITIASGGCNVMSYLTTDPKEIVALDLNRAHVALNRLKLAAVRNLPDYQSFYRFFGAADEKSNIQLYERFLKNNIDPTTRDYWEGRDLTAWGRKRITLFSRDLYHHGMLGYFIGAGHLVARLYGVDLKQLARAKTLDEQRSYFDKTLAPLFDKRLVRWATSKKMSLYGLGIPPAQYEALASAGDGNMAVVLKQRLERLACGFPMSENYFAWQAFNRGYAEEGSSVSLRSPAGPLPPYLQEQHYETIRGRADRVKVLNRSFTEYLSSDAGEGFDGYVLLDAQDWMTDQQLNDLWWGITQSAKPGARVIFRTAAEPSVLPGRVADGILDQWFYHEEESHQLNLQDRSSIYGGFHIYQFKGADQ